MLNACHCIQVVSAKLCHPLENATWALWGRNQLGVAHCHLENLRLFLKTTTGNSLTLISQLLEGCFQWWSCKARYLVFIYCILVKMSAWVFIFQGAHEIWTTMWLALPQSVITTLKRATNKPLMMHAHWRHGQAERCSHPLSIPLVTLFNMVCLRISPMFHF